MTTLLDRPELLACEVWYDKFPDETTIYLQVSGKSPEVTNHLSDARFEVVAGSGFIATKGMIANVGPGDEITVLHGNRYFYGGELSMLVNFDPILLPDFVTLGDEKLSRRARRIAHRVYHEPLTSRVMREYAERLAPDVEGYIDFIYSSLGKLDNNRRATGR